MKRTRQLLVALLTCSAAGPTLADELHVNAACGNDAWSGALAECMALDGPKATIQAAIDVAANGDEIIVAPGTYNEAIDLLGRSVHLRSSDGAELTTIDATGLGTTVVTCTTGEGPETIIEGFTITAGTGTPIPDLGNARGGGGMYSRGTSPTVRDCVFSQNAAVLPDDMGIGGGVLSWDGGSPSITDCIFMENTSNNGAAICAFGSDPVVLDCHFEGNTATAADPQFGRGGAVYCVDATSRFTRCTFFGNGATLGGAISTFSWNQTTATTIVDCVLSANAAQLGGAVDNIRPSAAAAPNEPVLLRCVIESNVASIAGGAVRNLSAPARMVNCQFVGNSAGEGGGIYNLIGAHAVVTTCTFFENSATESGGAIRSEAATTASLPLITNCTFTANSAASGGALHSSNGASPTVVSSILWGNGGGEIVDVGGSSTVVSYSDVQGGYPGPGNIDTDPQCVDPTGGDMRLGTTSPCIDSGDGAAVPADDQDLDDDTDTTEPTPYDLDGNRRFVDDPATPDTGVPGPNGVVVDMGAYEYQACPADTDGSGAVDTDDLINVIFDWGTDGTEHGGDIDGSGLVDVDDLTLVILAWGECP
ncbi:MAG: right-handed parallel beta-helix repeat-containing protein [Planctomycetota bacterium]|jgi:predicted outer membrane repeat protein